MIKNGIVYVGVNDYKIDYFEGQFKVPDGISYNSYLITDEKIAVMDAVDAHYVDEWLLNVKNALGGRQPDYLVISHMEPDHSAGVAAFAEKYPQTVLVGNAKTFTMLKEYFGNSFENRALIVKDGDELDLGTRCLQFVFAPMVHWPEVMVSYENSTKTLFSADAFGKFGALDGEGGWDDEARRYYIGIVGKYGVQVCNLFKKFAGLEICRICPLHGPVLENNIGHYLDLYKKWASYTPEKTGVTIAYTSVYGHTEKAAKLLYDELIESGAEAKIFDLVRSDMSECVANAFKYDKLVLATTTYNGEIFPKMREFIDELTERNFQSRKVAVIENGSWAPVAAKFIVNKFDKCKNIVFVENTVTVRAALNEESLLSLKNLAEELNK